MNHFFSYLLISFGRYTDKLVLWVPTWYLYGIDRNIDQLWDKMTSSKTLYYCPDKRWLNNFSVLKLSSYDLISTIWSISLSLITTDPLALRPVSLGLLSISTKGYWFNLCLFKFNSSLTLTHSVAHRNTSINNSNPLSQQVISSHGSVGF